MKDLNTLVTKANGQRSRIINLNFNNKSEINLCPNSRTSGEKELNLQYFVKF